MIKALSPIWPHLRELIAFGAVGGLATVTHYCVALFLVEQLHSSVYLANTVAYLIAVAVSFFGHSAVTFKKDITKQRAIKFAMVSISAFLLSQLLLMVLSNIEALGHRIEFAIVVVFIPLYSFVLSKFWVYRG